MFRGHDLRWLKGSVCFFCLDLLAQQEPHPQDALDLPPVLNAQFTVEPATGSLIWSLPMGIVPGEIPIPVVYRWDQPAVPGGLAPATMEALHFGFVTPPLASGTGGLDLESTQQLEDGTRLRGSDWQGPILDGTLPSTFGLAGPKGGLVSDRSRTYGFYACTLTDLGKWGSKVADLTPERRFMVLLDQARARVYAYQGLAKVMVPVLWLDRFGHMITFQWQQSATQDGQTLTVRALREDGKGVQVCRLICGPPGKEVDLLRADYLGIQSPSLLVRGYPASLGHQPPDPETSCLSAVAASRPTRIQVGSPCAFSSPGLVSVPPDAPATSGNLAREWTFSYEGNDPHELTTLQDPRGLATWFGYQTCQLPGLAPSFRVIAEVTSLDQETGVRHTQTWARRFPGTLGKPWTVHHQASYSDGQETEQRTTIYTFVHDQAGSTHTTLQKLETQGGNGNYQRTTYGPRAAGSGSQWDWVRYQATGSPDRETSWKAQGGSGAGSLESLKVGGVHVQTTAATHGSSPLGLGPSLLASRTTQRCALPWVQEHWHYSKEGLPSRHTIKAGKEERGVSYGYDPEGRLASTGTVASWTAEAGPIHTYVPGPLGPTAHAISGALLDHPLKEQWSYDSAGRIVSHTDAQGIKTSYDYDLWGRLTSLDRAGNPKLECAYPDERTRTWSQGHVKGEERYDGFGRLRSRLRPGGGTEHYETDTLGRRTLIRETSGQGERIVSRRGFDALDRLILQQTGSGPSFTYTYAATGPWQTVTIGSGDEMVCTQTWDPWGQLLERKEQGLLTGFTYNEFGQVAQIKQTDPEGKFQVRTFKYDGLGKLARVTVPETGTTTLGVFNALGQPGRITDASGRTQTRTYDALGRLVARANGRLRLTNHYQGPLLVGRSSTEGIAQTFSYGGPGGRMDGESLIIDRIVHKLGYGYEANGMLDQVKYPNGATVGYVHDEAGRVSQVTYNGAVLADLSHDGWGNLAVLRFASGAKSTWRLDAKGQRLEAWDVAFTGGVESRKYAYDSSAHLIQAGEWSMEHDGSGRLALATGFGMTSANTHDAFGNNLAHAVKGKACGRFNAFSMAPPADNRIPGIQSNGALTGWVVDPNGEAAQIGTAVSSKRILSLGWDGLGRLSGIHDSVTGDIRQYSYAPSGLRVGVSSTSNPSENRMYLYSDQGVLHGEYLGSKGWIRNVVYLGEQAIAEIDAKGTHELHSDHLGTPRLITCGANANLEGRQSFGPFGETMEGDSCTAGYRPLTGYTGHLQTDPTELIYMRGRFYSPAWHRFLNSDQGADPESLNQFAYVCGKPFQAIDPAGMMVKAPPMRGGLIDGGGATVVVSAPMAGPVPKAPVPMAHQPPPIPVIPFFGTGPMPYAYPAAVGVGGVAPWGPGNGTRPPAPPPAKQPAPAEPINPERLNFKTPVEKPGTPAGSLAVAIADGKYNAAAAMLQAKKNQEGALKTYQAEVRQAIDDWTKAGSIKANLKAYWDAPSTVPKVIEVGLDLVATGDLAFARFGLKGISLGTSSALLGFSQVWKFMDGLVAIENHSLSINSQLEQRLNKASKKYWETVNGN